MSAGQVVLLVAGILAFNVAMWAVAIVWIRRRLVRRRAELHERVTGLGEAVVLGPENATFRGATARFGRVRGLGVAAVTGRRLLFYKAIGRPLEIELAEVVGVRFARWFLRSYSGATHLIVQLRDGTEVGFFVRQPDRWTAALGVPASGQPAGSM